MYQPLNSLWRILQGHRLYISVFPLLAEGDRKRAGGKRKLVYIYTQEPIHIPAPPLSELVSPNRPTHAHGSYTKHNVRKYEPKELEMGEWQ